MKLNDNFFQKPPTLKELKAMRKPYPYDEVAQKLNNLTDVSQVDKIIAEGEIQSCNMVGIKKLFRMIKNPWVQQQMKIQYNL